MYLSSLFFKARIQSILQDAEYVREFSKSSDLPIIANRRCGSWYVPPDILSGSCYFKSTDGHVGQWAFNHRRLNLHLLPMIESSGGCIIVDSTHGSKKMSDALSKTIPIWCAVINHLLFPDDEISSKVFLPPDDVLASKEAYAICQNMPRIRASARSLDLDLQTLRKQITRPLVPHFVENPRTKAPDSASAASTRSIICLMASHNQVPPENSNLDQATALSMKLDTSYIRGAGDDEDNWAFGLQPFEFWRDQQTVMEYVQSDGGLSKCTVQAIVESRRNQVNNDTPTQIGNLPLFIGRSRDHVSDKILQAQTYTAIIICNEQPRLKPRDEAETVAERCTKLLQLNLREGKIGSRQLRSKLPQVLSFISNIRETYPSVMIVDEAGQDLAVGICLAMLCLFYNDGRFRRLPPERDFDKDFIRKQLAVIASCKYDFDPSRATLQSVHAFLMPKGGFGDWLHEKRGSA